MSKRIFISYATEDLEDAERLYGALESEGFSPWMDRQDLLAGQSWKTEIPKVLRNSEQVIVLLSSRSLSKRGYVQKELRMALDILDEFPPGRIFLVPVKLDRCKPEIDRLAGLHWVELFPSWEKGFAAILRALRHGIIEDGIERPSLDLVSESELRKYCQKAAAFHEKIDMVGFRTRVRARIGVDEIYIPLDAVIDDRATGKGCFLDAEDAARCLEKTGAGTQISLPDAFLTSERLGRRGMAILGDPGSGKTTHLKRLMLWCLNGGLSRLGLAEDLLPVFLPLRELRDTSKDLSHFIPRVICSKPLACY